MARVECDRDCFNCKFDDCIDDGISKEEYQAQKEIDSEAIFEKIPKNPYSRKWYLKNKEKNREKSRKYYWANHEKCLEKNRKYYRENKEKFREYERIRRTNANRRTAEKVDNP